MSDTTPVTPVTAGDISVTTAGGELVPARDTQLAAFGTDGVPAALVAHDDTLWGPDAQHEASIRLGWLDAPTVSRELLPRLGELRQQLLSEGLDRVVLCGMGGSSLAPEVITATAEVELVVLDGTDPGQVNAAFALNELHRTVVVVSSKSGGTLETDSHRRAALAAFTGSGLSNEDAARRLVVVTDPGSPLEKEARSLGVREVFLADPNIGGRYSALSAFGLVPSALAGADVEALLDEAAALTDSLSSPTDNPALALGAALGGGGVTGRDKIVLADNGSGVTGFGDWAEQLIAESTGKLGKGLLPVVVENPHAPGTEPEPDTHVVHLGGSAPQLGTGVSGPLGGLFQTWEYAVAVAGRSLGINPFDQPNVQESKDNTNKLLESYEGKDLPEGTPTHTYGPVQVFGDTPATDLAGVLTWLLEQIPDRGYLAVMAYLDRHAQSELATIRARLAGRTAHPVTFGWAPRFLHSTGQFHKGGPQVGVFLQISGEIDGPDLAIPGRSFSFGRLQRAQTLGDNRALSERNRPVLRLHLTNRSAGVAALLDAAAGT